ncbi:MAG TPA: class I SAM-dependent methyltransferase [Nitrospirae bacterium]|nr:class I SAM-dependent methyltransferase [Nitrospirota bacterium]
MLLQMKLMFIRRFVMSGNYIKSVIRTVLQRPAITKRLVWFFLRLHNFSYGKVGFLSKFLEPGGIHPKHRIMRYHDWFVKRINSSWSVLDVGCGNGALTFDIGKAAKEVVGIDFEEANIRAAMERHKRENIRYVCGDARTFNPDFKVDCIVLSNVLEHIEDRKEFLEMLKKISSRFLIRVPMFERDWITPYKKESGVEWRLDITHRTEYTKDSFYEEIRQAGMTIKEQEIMWGEIYAVAEANKA